MTAYLIRRIFQALFVMLAMAVLVFAAVYMLGNPVDALLSPDSDQIERAAAIQRLGLDRPLYEQFGLFLWNAVRGDLGTSFVYGIPAIEVLMLRLPTTLELAVFAMLLALAIGIPLGIIAGMRPGSFAGKTIMAGSILGFSLPAFWVGLMLILIFAVTLQLLPSGGRGETVQVFGANFASLTLDGLKHMILPATTLALYKASLVIRVCESGTREVMSQDYIRFARAKGLGFWRIVSLHIFKNVMIPVVTIMGMEFGGLLAFSVVVETIYAYQGMGELLISSINRLDRPVVVTYLLFTTVMFVVINLVVDILYAVLDPRIRLSEESA
ncbi:MAG: ABC transporter permease [Rhodobacterales bacterium]|uniref:ABC transporter permease n=1 Tax=Gemmobacter nectariphilus TaxID=220343 RepID=UPI00040974A3|nr:ABC transporter permease [Gemmobacter nectariphilus]MDX5359355.1 ABC transporter permease [Rhodobacterales bacterium]MDX5501572.1 ABC transporter permease [Rhodobacterales bacterium]